jgi:hypothetical protein
MEITKKLKRQPRRDDDNGFADHGGYMTAKVSKLEEQFLSIQVGSTDFFFLLRRFHGFQFAPGSCEAEIEYL